VYTHTESHPHWHFDTDPGLPAPPGASRRLTDPGEGGPIATIGGGLARVPMRAGVLTRANAHPPVPPALVGRPHGRHASAPLGGLARYGGRGWISMGMGGPILAWHRVVALQDPGSPRTLALSGKKGGRFSNAQGAGHTQAAPFASFLLNSLLVAGFGGQSTG
jgi:hypothetical protein